MDLSILTNPWTVESIYEFSFFCCPECDTKCSNKQEFVNHAFQTHPLAIHPLHGIKDGSLDDITFPSDEDQKLMVKTEHDTQQEDVKEPNFKHKDDLYKTLDPDLDDDDIKDELFEEEEDDVKSETFSCDLCRFSASNPKVLIAHVKYRHGNSSQDHKKEEKPKQICSTCNEEFKSLQQLRMHMLKAHKISKSSEKCLCTLCGKTLIGRSNLKKHEREKHGIDNAKFIRKDKLLKIECEKCASGFETCQDLNQHVITCLEKDAKFPCFKCEVKWASGPVLNLHLKMDHKMIEMFTCDTCGKCLKKKVSLLSHVKVEHENIKDHVCHLCGRGFARVQGLQFHIKRVHENTGKHFCERCPFKAITKPELDIHINEVHTKAIKFHCDQCNFFCYRKGGLAAHIKNVHLKLRPHQCHCGQAFVRRKELEKHKEWANH